MNMSPKNSSISSKVFVALSGGVDSAVSAALLKAQGYDVTGVFIKGWQPEWMRGAGGSSHCTWREERRDAMKVCIALNIPFLFFDFEKEYKQAVVDKMLAEYKAGRTPNPDVLCNREIKFGIFWQKAKEMGADYIATGHYWSGEKDQSYFLWTLTQEDLSHTLFPVGNLEKSEVRRLARKYKLPVAEKKDSQGICFIGDVNMEKFLSHYIETKPGRVMNTDGEVIGKHKGLIYYTIGERHGFEVTKKGPESGPFYVVAKNARTNSILVSDSESEILELSPREVLLKDVNWINEPESEELIARIRYRGEKLPCALSLSGKKLSIRFKEPVRGLSLGQSIVFYSSDHCLGGAIMDKVLV
ncbi:MAG: tRNA 2-thiouridine(34) synthase MnmA [Candidatus Zambryskibacteria bacterium]|nr:tRNA 2-thiouridine(34) synthase MnmA [Candidatus Zambryskibacteria bacterium]